MPRNIESIANLMMADSDINVYSDTNNNIIMKDVAFNIRGNKTKVGQFKKNQELNERKQRAYKRVQEYEKKKLQNMQQAPESIIKRAL
jgi:hypothetical protein